MRFISRLFLSLGCCFLAVCGWSHSVSADVSYPDGQPGRVVATDVLVSSPGGNPNQNGLFPGLYVLSSPVANAITLNNATIFNNQDSITIDADYGIELTGLGTFRVGWAGQGYHIRINSIISGVGSLGVSGDSPQEVQLYNVNTYQGRTIIGANLNQTTQEATLATYVNNALPHGTVVEFGVSSSQLLLKGTQQTVTGFQSNATNYGRIVGDGGYLHVKIPTSESYTYSGTFDGGTGGTTWLDVALEGEGTLVYGGNNTATRTHLFLNSGTLALDRTGRNDMLSHLTLNGGTVEFRNTDNINWITGRLTINASFGKLDLAGAKIAFNYADHSSASIPNDSIYNSNPDKAALMMLHNVGAGTVSAHNDIFDGNNYQLGVRGNSGSEVYLAPNQTFTGGVLLENVLMLPEGVGNFDGSYLGVIPATFKKDAIILSDATLQNHGNGTSDGNVVIHANQGIELVGTGAFRVGWNVNYYFEVNSVISGSGNLGVSHDAAAEVRLYGKNTYAGKTIIGSSQLAYGNSGAILATYVDGALPSTTVVEFNNGATDGSTNVQLRLKGTNQTVAGLTSSSQYVLITNEDHGQATLTVNTAAGASYDYTGLMAGNIHFVKTGAGMQTFTNNLAHTGGTEIQAGVLNFRAAADTTMTVASEISGAGTLSINDGADATAGSVVLTGNNAAFTGGTVFAGAADYTVTAGHDSAFGTGGSISLTNTGTTGLVFDTSSGKRTIANAINLNTSALNLTNSGGNEAIFAGALSGSGAFTSTGVNFEIDLADWSTNYVVWESLTGPVNFTDAEVTFYITSSLGDYADGTEFEFTDSLGNMWEKILFNFDAMSDPSGWSVGNGFITYDSGQSATPEPATWALMLLGLGAVACFRWRQRQSAAA